MLERMNILKLNRRFCNVASLGRARIISQSPEADALNTKLSNVLEFYSSLLHMTAKDSKIFLSKNPTLFTGNQVGNDLSFFDNVKETAVFLQKNNFTATQIKSRPAVLLLNRITIANRLKVFKECGFQNVEIHFFTKFISLMKKEITYLKALKVIKPEVNVAERLAEFLDVPIQIKNNEGDIASLMTTRMKIINLYLREKLEANDDEIDKIWAIYFRLRHRNIADIVETINLLINELGYNNGRILNNSFLLHACPDNIKKYFREIPTIADVSIKKILLERPKVVMVNAGGVKDIINHVKCFGIPEKSILKCLEILTLSPHTIYERLQNLRKVEEFSVLVNNPRVLRLIHYQSKAKTRLDFLKQLNLKCASLHVLSASSDCFEKYARDGIDHTKGVDLVIFIAKALNMDRHVVREILHRHPNRSHVPLVTVKAVINYLRYKGFTDQEIITNLILLLYPVVRIDEKLSILLEWKKENVENRLISGVALSAISNSKLLTLCLYFIEKEFHFLGDGTWEPAPDGSFGSSKQDLYQTTIPEFPKSLTKEYRFGVTKKVVATPEV